MKRVIRSSVGIEYTRPDNRRAKYYQDQRGSHIFEGEKGQNEVEFPTDKEAEEYIDDSSEVEQTADESYYIVRYDGRSTSYFCKGRRWRYSANKEDLLLMDKDKANSTKKSFENRDKNHLYYVKKI